jgi:hypothetical protein
MWRYITLHIKYHLYRKECSTVTMVYKLTLIWVVDTLSTIVLYKRVFISYSQSINVETAIEIIVTIASPMLDNDRCARSAELGVGGVGGVGGTQ